MSVSETTHFLQRAIESECLFNGDWEPASGTVIPVIEPATGEPLMNCAMASPADIAVASRSAALAQPAWAALGPRERAEVFRKAAEVARQSFAELALYVARETGAALFKGEHEVREAIVLLHQAAGLLSQPHGVVLPSAVPISVSSRICPTPSRITGSKNQRANTAHSQRGLKATD